jgi:hypothetical protein
MEEDLAAGRPMLTALRVASPGQICPLRDAEMFHREVLGRALLFYGAPTH